MSKNISKKRKTLLNLVKSLKIHQENSVNVESNQQFNLYSVTKPPFLKK